MSEFPGKTIAAAVLAGGLGTRLRTVVADRPKVLAPVAGEPFLAHLLRQLRGAGLSEAVLLVGFGADQVQHTFGSEYCGLKLRYSEEPDPLGTGGAVRFALPLLAGDTILLLNGDSYCGVDLPAFIASHHCLGGPLSLTLTWVEDAARFGRVTLGEDDRVLRFEEKRPDPAPGWINAGIYLIDRKLFEVVPCGTACSLERDLLPKWMSRHDVYGLRGGRFLDIGVPESYARADDFFRSHV